MKKLAKKNLEDKLEIICTLCNNIGWQEVRIGSKFLKIIRKIISPPTFNEVKSEIKN
jgi:hypothetical protein